MCTKLDIPITYIVYWYNTLYQVEPVVWTSITTSRIVIRLVHATGKTLDLLHSLVPTHYVCNKFI
jgi:hypothetical protein